MTYRWNLERIIRTDDIQTADDWATHLTYTARAVIRTVRLALENDNAGFCTDEYRTSAAADTLELAEAMLAIVTDGTERMSRDLKRGTWRPKEAAQTFPEGPAGSQS